MRRVFLIPRFSLIILLLTALDCPAFSEDINTLTKKAMGGDAQAQFDLGVAYMNGQGVPQDYVQSYFWSSLAASRSTGEEHKIYSTSRNNAAQHLSPDRLLEAERMTIEWEKLHPRK